MAKKLHHKAGTQSSRRKVKEATTEKPKTPTTLGDWTYTLGNGGSIAHVARAIELAGLPLTATPEERLAIMNGASSIDATTPRGEFRFRERATLSECVGVLLPVWQKAERMLFDVPASANCPALAEVRGELPLAQMSQLRFEFASVYSDHKNEPGWRLKPDWKERPEWKEKSDWLEVFAILDGFGRLAPRPLIPDATWRCVSVDDRYRCISANSAASFRRDVEHLARIAARLATTGQRSDGIALSGAGTIDPNKPKATKPVHLTAEHEVILAFLAKRPTKCLMVHQVTGAETTKNRETVGILLKELKDMGVVYQPYGSKKGYALTDAGLAIALPAK